jgi:hypothetical protein
MWWYGGKRARVTPRIHSKTKFYCYTRSLLHKEPLPIPNLVDGPTMLPLAMKPLIPTMLVDACAVACSFLSEAQHGQNYQLKHYQQSRVVLVLLS